MGSPSAEGLPHLIQAAYNTQHLPHIFPVSSVVLAA
nr:MAG TPA: hypothetical protein [Caudoviricetes sp.]